MALFIGGALFSSLFFLIHLASTWNPYHRVSVPLFFSLALTTTAWFSSVILTGEEPILALISTISLALEALFEIIPLVLAAFTVQLFRITLLTNRPVGATS